jgi:hypothetical protein
MPDIVIAMKGPIPPTPAPTGWQWDVSSLQDETDFYANVVGLTIPATEPGFDGNFSGSFDWEIPPNFGFGNIKNDTEADDLWTWYQQHKRYGGSFVVNGSDTVGDWYADVLNEYKTNLLTRLDADENSNVFPHMYGQGLAAVYNDTGDTSILPILDGLRTRIEGTEEYGKVATGGTMAVARFGARSTARHAIIAAHAYEATGDPAWKTVRDNLVTGFTTATDWQDSANTPIMAPGTGLYFHSRSSSTGSSGFITSPNDSATRRAAYDAGYRFNSTFMVGLMAEAMWRLYVQTGNAILRERLIKMARYVQHYAHDPSWNYPNVGSYFGHTDTGDRWWTRNISHSRSDGTLALADTECSYDAALINIMVIGYKLTGEQSMLDKARVFFSRCNRWHPGADNFLAASENHLLKYMDTTPNNSRDKMQWNKGVLQYGYQVFENGGNPSALV